jgi:hypothetical protein
MAAPPEVLELVERFQRDAPQYRSSTYNETMLRRDFLDPFFGALGWDVANTQGIDLAHRDVIHEDAIKIGSFTKAPDYCFRTGGERRFFVEAKRPSVNLERDPSPAFQLRRYAWSAGLPLSILTDFEEFAIYDCRVMPDKNDKASVARLLYIECADYERQWDRLVGQFSREAVLGGAIDEWAQAIKPQRGASTVDAAFLKEIESWREKLAQNIAIWNKGLSQRDLNYAVQMTIDRIIFLRIAEVRGTEPYGRLQALLNGGDTYPRLCQLFHQADARYNSGLFHFETERSRPEPPDDLTLTLTIDDDPLKRIVKGLYYPDSPYEFSVLPVEILGQVYEQFLGKVIHLDTDRRVTVEDKPEVRKAGGVYYTPKYIVDYIVEHTVGKLLAGQTPRQVRGLVGPRRGGPLRILDPACGSGSFLIGAYQYLLAWYRDWYVTDGPEKHRKELYQAHGGDWCLTTDERKRILLDHIYGVDIDPQAVEVTKLSLLLKVLEGETEQTLNTTLAMFHERALPDLSNNIKCGNSLVGPDFYDSQQATLIDEDERYRINAFDWQSEFPPVMITGGFDIIIGNPPYLYSAGQHYSNYFSIHYQLSQYQTDYYVYFIERALHLACRGGALSFIVGDSWLNSEYFSKMRSSLLADHRIDLIAVFDYPVFKQAALENSIFCVAVSGMPTEIKIDRFQKPGIVQTVNTINPTDALERHLIDPRRSVDADRAILAIESGSQCLESRVEINRGIHAYRTDGYGQSKFGPGPQTRADKDTASYHATTALDKTYLPELKGKHVGRFIYTPSGQYVSYGQWLAEPRERSTSSAPSSR